LLPSQVQATVLLVEDEHDLRLAIADYLHMLGFEVLEANNGEDALLQLEAFLGKITATITDAVMPDMGGIELIAKIRERGHNCKFILMSGRGDAQLASHIELQHEIVFLLKPFKLKDLADRLLAIV
jgi:two-component system cell cycle sensor histidine kinase/response regulator CckA